MPQVTLYPGDNRDSLRRLISNGVRVHSVVTDPPYGLVSVQKRFGKEGSAAARTEGNDGSFARLSGGFMGKCFHPDTEVMTDRGWRRVTDIEIGDIVATLNTATRDLEWQAVEQTHAYPFEGEMVHVKHRSAEQMVTPNHRIVVSYDGGKSLELVEPLRTKAHFHLFAQANPATGIKGTPITISSEREYGRDRRVVHTTATFDARAFFRFFGLWLGDGYTCTRSDDHPANDFFGFAVKKERKIAAIRQALLDLKIKFNETPGGEGEITNFYCYDFALLGFLKTIGKAADKYIPTWMFDRDASELEEVYQGLLETDGCRQSEGQEVYYTISRRLAEDFQRLCLHTGRSAISVFVPGGAPVSICGNKTVSSDRWTLCVLQADKRMYGERSNSSSNVIFEKFYAGTVHCVGVPRHHILYTRFNGKPVWSGNSWDGTGIERDPEFWKLIYDILLPGGYVFAFSGSRTGHWQACAMETAGFIMHPMHGWVFGCMDTATECLTRRGWLSYTDLLPNDEVLQWDSASDTLSWVIPERVHEYDFDGQMVQIKNRHTHQVLTPNHRVYAKVRRHSRHPKPTAYEVIEAREVQARPGNWQVDLPMAATLYQSEAVVDPTFAYLVGWWLTDAWPHKDANACCFSQSKPVTLTKLRAALEGLGASEYVKPAKKATHNDEHTFYLTGPMFDRLRNEFPDRVLGWHVLGWSIEARQALYEGLMDGDGSRNKTGQIAEAFWSQKKERRDVFLALALSIGIRCYEDPAKGVVYVNPKTRTTQVQGKQRAEPLPYKGKVWCLTVPTGAFVVRRSGRPFITGNSGFPKAHAADKAIDKHLGKFDQREVTGKSPYVNAKMKAGKGVSGLLQTGSFAGDYEGERINPDITAPATPEAAQWEGWAYGTQAQKPALEPIYLGQKPFSEKTGAANLLKHGVGAVNIDGCRVPMSQEDFASTSRNGVYGKTNAGVVGFQKTEMRTPVNSEGRHPANLILDGSTEVVAMFPESKGQQGDVRGTEKSRTGDEDTNCYGEYGRIAAPKRGDNSGSAARFFHQFPQNHCCLCEQEVELCDVSIAGRDLTIRSTQTDASALSNAADSLQPESADKRKLSTMPATYAERFSEQFRQTSSDFARQNAAGSLEANIAQNAKCAANLCDSCATAFAQSLVQTSQGKSPESLLSRAFITERKKQILTQSLALIAATPESIGTTTTTPNLKLWFGFVLRAIDDTISLEFQSPNNVSGGPLRYSAKAGKLDRAGSRHPTVKPIALMQYLIRHITPPGGVVLDPFAGSGTTAEAARREGFDCILMEAESEYIDFLNSRFNITNEQSADLCHEYLSMLGVRF